MQKVTTKTVTREDFVIALNAAEQVLKEKYRNSLLAHYCEEFIDRNTKLSKAHNKAFNRLKKPVLRDLNNFCADNAFKKDGYLLRNEKGGFEFDAAGQKAVNQKQDDVNDKLEDVIDDFLNEKVEVKVLTAPLVLPKDILYDDEKALTGFVFVNPKPFADVTFEEEQPTAQN